MTRQVPVVYAERDLFQTRVGSPRLPTRVKCALRIGRCLFFTLLDVIDRFGRGYPTLRVGVINRGLHAQALRSENRRRCSPPTLISAKSLHPTLGEFDTQRTIKSPVLTLRTLGNNHCRGSNFPAAGLLARDNFRVARDTPKIRLPVRVLSVIACLQHLSNARGQLQRRAQE
jgi:hypothetical protein